MASAWPPIQALVEPAAPFGPVAINRAYGNGQFFGRYRDALLQNAVELIQLFAPGASAKDGADSQPFGRGSGLVETDFTSGQQSIWLAICHVSGQPTASPRVGRHSI